MTGAEQLRFWEVYSQLGPVVMIALAIEARLLARAISGGGPLWARLTTALMPFGPLFTVGIFTIAAINGVGGQTYSVATVWLAKAALMAGVGAFLVLCSLDVLGRAVPDLMARAMSPMFVHRIVIARERRKVKRLMSVLEERTVEWRATHERMVDAASNLLAALDDEIPPDLVDLVEEAQRDVAEADSVLDDSIIDHVDLLEVYEQWKLRRPMRVIRSHQLRTEETREIVEAVFGK